MESRITNSDISSYRCIERSGELGNAFSQAWQTEGHLLCSQPQLFDYDT